MTDVGEDSIGILNLSAWNASETSLLSYAKTPIQQTFFTNNSDLIGKALRNSIIHFADTINDVDRSACVLGNEFRSTRTHRYPVPRVIDGKAPELVTMEVTTFAPIAFEYIRSVIGIMRNDFHQSFDHSELINFANTGRSGSQMYKTSDDVYIIKTLRDHEAKLLIQTLSGIYLRYAHQSSLITRYVGLYSVNVRSVLSAEIFCVVMLNNLPSILDIHEIYDLKGSSVGRYSTVDLPMRRMKALKDLDFESFYPFGIRIPHSIYRRLRKTLEGDVAELGKMMITDFSLMLGVHHLDGHSTDGETSEMTTNLYHRPQLGISSLFAATNIDPAAIRNTNGEESLIAAHSSKEKLINRFAMKPLHVIACPLEDTFDASPTAKSLLGIPGVTHDGRRVLLYPAFIDCLQTYDNFKHIQHVLQNIRDPKRGSEYSVIDSEEYGKRLLKFLFDEVLIESTQSLDELVLSPMICNSTSDRSSTTESLNTLEHDNADERRESFEVIQITNRKQTPLVETHVIQTTEVLQNLTIPSLHSAEGEKILIDSTSP